MTIFLDNLPNEVLLKVFTYLNIRDLGYCAQVSKRLGDISIDESLWQKINVFNKVVPTGFIQHILKVRKSQKKQTKNLPNSKMGQIQKNKGTLLH